MKKICNHVGHSPMCSECKHGWEHKPEKFCKEFLCETSNKFVKCVKPRRNK